DALAQYLFSRRMKVTARDIAALVRETQAEVNRKRQADPQTSLIDALIQEEMGRITSLRASDNSPALSDGFDGGQSLDPKAFIDTSSWATDFDDLDDAAPTVIRPDSIPPEHDLDSLS